MASILFLCNYKSLYGGNFIPSLRALEKSLFKKGINCVYCFPEDSKDRDWIKEMVEDGCKIVFINFSLKTIDFLHNIREIVITHDVSIVHSHHVRTLLMDIYSLYDRNCKVIIHLHSDFSGGKRSLKKKCFDFIAYKLLSVRTHMISVSETFVSYNPHKIVWIPNALAHFTSQSDIVKAVELRNKLNIPDHTFICEVFGWSPYVKGLDIAVKSIKQLVDKGLNISLLVVCGRDMTEEKLKTWIKSRTNIDGNASFIKYVDPREDVYVFHEVSDILLSSSRSEGFSYSVLEMLSIGKTVVSSDIPALKWAKKYPTCVFFKSEDTDSCAQSLSFVTHRLNSVKRSDVTSRILNDYSIDRWVGRIVKYYKIEHAN